MARICKLLTLCKRVLDLHNHDNICFHYNITFGNSTAKTVCVASLYRPLHSLKKIDPPLLHKMNTKLVHCCCQLINKTQVQSYIGRVIHGFGR